MLNHFSKLSNCYRNRVSHLQEVYYLSRAEYSSNESTVYSDPACDPTNPKILQFGDISLAHHKLQGGVVRTTCRKSRGLSKLFDMDLHLKMEVNQVYAASAGNHALALSLHGKELGVEINVVMPKFAPLMKLARCREFGSKVLVEGDDISISRIRALQMAAEKGGTYINGFDHYDILAGAGTIGIEILGQVSQPDAIIVPIGGGGLVAGVATAVKSLNPKTKIIGVVSNSCQAIIKSLEAGTPVYSPTKATLADGLAVPSIGVNAFASLKGKVDDVITVAENDIAIGILRLLETEKVVCEGAGAVGIAALLSGKLDFLKGKKVVSILSGGNIDSTSLGRCIERGLAYDHRVIRISVIIPDNPGGLATLTKFVAENQANIRDLYLERAFLRNDMSNQRVKMIVEVRDRAHEEELKKNLIGRYSPENCDFKSRLPEGAP